MAEPLSYAVVIVTWNHAGTLPACLAAVGSLEPRPRTIVLIDNASHDGSADLAEGSDHVPGLVVVREDRNTGFAAAVNHALRVTDDDWVLVLNPDCAPRPDMVAALMNGLAQRPERTRVGTLTPLLLRSRGKDLKPSGTVDAAGMVMTPSGRHLDRGAGRAADGSVAAPAWVFGGTAAAALYRRAALDDVAYPNGEVMAESFFAYREDAELAWRLQLRGWRCLYVPEARAAHLRGFRPEEGRRGHQTTNRYSVRNRFLLRAHCADVGWHVRCLPWWLLRDLAVVGACLTIERSSLAALRDLWRLRHDAKSRRRWVLGRRSVPPRQMARWFRIRGRVEETAGP